MLCNICKEKSFLEEHYTKAPNRIADGYDAETIQQCDIEIYHCESCGHIQIIPMVLPSYYQEYSMGYFWGASFTKTRKQQIERLAGFAPSCKRFLDIGCGTGQYLSLAQPFFKELYGVEPSKTGANLASEKGFCIINDYFSSCLKFEQGFDAISMIEVLEHLENPYPMVSYALMCLNTDGVMLIEVPNGQKIYRESLYYNLSTDHIQYFTVQSLAALAKHAGAEILCVQEASDPNLLELYVRKKRLDRENFHMHRQRDLSRILSELSFGDRIAAWGAGAEAVCFLEMLQEHIKMECLFDNDTLKHGHSIAQCPILPPAKDVVCGFDAIILFANAHKTQIYEQLTDLGFTGKFIAFNS